jgi:hypothetical protein
MKTFRPALFCFVHSATQSLVASSRERRRAACQFAGVLAALLLSACGSGDSQSPSSGSSSSGSSTPVAPSITAQPVSKTVDAGQSATFSVTATGTSPLTYQWQKNGALIAEATSATYTLQAAVTADSGSKLAVVVSNSAGSVTSNAALLTVDAAAAPTITQQPLSQTVATGQVATFGVTAAGTAPLSYLWKENGAVIPGATSASYSTPPTTSAANGATFTVEVSNAAGHVTSMPATLTVTATTQALKTVFLILMENHNWSTIKGNAEAPYINNTLLVIGSHAEQYYNPPANHPSLPNYLWLEAGTNFGILNDDLPSINHQSTTMHLVTLLESSGLSWRSYDEDIDGATCPLTDVSLYVAHHDPFVYFDDVTNSNSPTSASCISHVRPFTQLASDVQSNALASYNFITPNLCDDMHNCSVTSGDTWLATNLPTIMNSSAYKNGGVIFITWDEAAQGDGPIGLIVISPFAKPGYANSTHYTHGSTLRTVEEIFHVTPLLGDAANESDLSDLFTSFP